LSHRYGYRTWVPKIDMNTFQIILDNCDRQYVEYLQDFYVLDKNYKNPNDYCYYIQTEDEIKNKVSKISFVKHDINK